MRNAEQMPSLARPLNKRVIVHTPRFFSGEERFELAGFHERLRSGRGLGNGFCFL